ncbi:LysE/ArgO family amino acid transporter [Corynebacterium epidermidicanis]|uniref:Lysine efflux permease n=1 Tax=Corynebacterium epidermidicanis TaxID=1050174 RepID=A0A0G3GP63_9CORY|nr:LysE/ArgO family amino acid transporter [Corynebacterium epidermidicanis]AKK02944.1 lysine efflux permease [Corynebacterium epidermidicanis]
MSIFLSGFLMGLSLIIAIGPQNALILKQGIKREPVTPILIVCLLSDVLLILGGTAGVGVLVDKAPAFLVVLKWLGVAYLLFFGYTCFRDARRSQALTVDEAAPVPEELFDAGNSVSTATLTKARPVAASWKAPVLAALTFTWLNPAAYVDTLVMLGGIANQYGSQLRWVFSAGALLASCVWFPALGYGALKLSGPLSQPEMWRRVNFAIGCLMVFLAVRLILH